MTPLHQRYFGFGQRGAVEAVEAVEASYPQEGQEGSSAPPRCLFFLPAHGVAWAGVAWRGAAWCAVARRGSTSSCRSHAPSTPFKLLPSRFTLAGCHPRLVVPALPPPSPTTPISVLPHTAVVICRPIHAAERSEWSGLEQLIKE